MVPFLSPFSLLFLFLFPLISPLTPLPVPFQAAVINLDDLLAPLVRERTGAMPIVTYSYGNTDADVHVDSAKFTAFESELIVKTPEGRLQVTHRGLR